MSTSLSPVSLSQLLLALSQTQWQVSHPERLPEGAILVVSNHRSFIDPLVLMLALGRTIHFACHAYMVRMPVLAQIVDSLECLPLEHYRPFVTQVQTYWQQEQAVGIFPEGAVPMLKPGQAHEVGPFQRGFVHLAQQMPGVPIVPVALRVRDEWLAPALPLSVLRWFVPDEPLFQGDATHPIVVYRQLEVVVLPPYYPTATDQPLVMAKGRSETIANHIQTQIQAEVARV